MWGRQRARQLSILVRARLLRNGGRPGLVTFGIWGLDAWLVGWVATPRHGSGACALPAGLNGHSARRLFGCPAVRLSGCPAVRLSGCPAVQDVGLPTLSASACGRSKRRRFGCRRTAKLRALTRGSCLTGAPWRGGSSTARRRLLRAQVAPIAPLRGAVGDAGCGADFSPPFLAGQKGRSPAGARPGQPLPANPAERQRENSPSTSKPRQRRAARSRQPNAP